MSGGTPPTRVFCSGHSLGAGLVSVMQLPAWLQHPSDLHGQHLQTPLLICMAPCSLAPLSTMTIMTSMQHANGHITCAHMCHADVIVRAKHDGHVTARCTPGMQFQMVLCWLHRLHCAVCGQRCSGLLLMSGWSRWAARQWAMLNLPGSVFLPADVPVTQTSCTAGHKASWEQGNNPAAASLCLHLACCDAALCAYVG